MQSRKVDECKPLVSGVPEDEVQVDAVDIANAESSRPVNDAGAAASLGRMMAAVTPAVAQDAAAMMAAAEALEEDEEDGEEEEEGEEEDDEEEEEEVDVDGVVLEGQEDADWVDERPRPTDAADAAAEDAASAKTPAVDATAAPLTTEQKAAARRAAARRAAAAAVPASESSSATSTPTPAAIKLCDGFQLGQCRFGDACRFSHGPAADRPRPTAATDAAAEDATADEAVKVAVEVEAPPELSSSSPASAAAAVTAAESSSSTSAPTAAANKPCYAFQIGACKFGAACRFSHGPDATEDGKRGRGLHSSTFQLNLSRFCR